MATTPPSFKAIKNKSSKSWSRRGGRGTSSFADADEATFERDVQHEIKVGWTEDLVENTYDALLMYSWLRTTRRSPLEDPNRENMDTDRSRPSEASTRDDKDAPKRKFQITQRLLEKL